MARAASLRAKRVLLTGWALASLHCGAPQKPARKHLSEVAQWCSADAPVPLPWGTVINASTTYGASKLEPSCVRAQAQECLYKLEVPSRSDVRIGLLTLSFDGSLSLRRANETRELACVDDTPLGDTHHTRLDLTLDPGSYVLAVDGSDGSAGPFELFAELDPLPDPVVLCANAEPLLEGGYTRGSTRAGAGVFVPACGGIQSAPDHVYSLPIARPSRVRVREQSEFDAILSLRDQCIPFSNELLCNDQSADGTAQLTAQLEAGSYFVVIDGYMPRDSGDFVLAYERQAIPAPSPIEQRCADAPTLAPDTRLHELDTFYAPSTTAGSCGGDGAPELFYKLPLAKRAHVIVGLSQRELDPVVYVRRDCARADSELACTLVPPTDRAHVEGAVQTVLALDLDAGDYTIVVDGQGPNDMGAATLHVALSAPLSAAPSGR